MNKIGWKDRKKDIQKGVLHTETNEEKSKWIKKMNVGVKRKKDMP